MKFRSIVILVFKANVNFSNPSKWDVVLAENAPISAVNNALYSSVPATKTSNAKNTAAIGVWNNPAKPAAIPVIKNILPLFSISIFLPILCATVAPIWTATPSLPALPPNKCVIHVLNIVNGISLFGITASSLSALSNTRVMPFILFFPILL